MDSLAVLDLARRVEPEVPVVFFESGLDYGETYDYLSKTTHTWRLDLHRIPTDPHYCRSPPRFGLWDHEATSDATTAAIVVLHECSSPNPPTSPLMAGPW
ncbi:MULTISPECIES: phosphoadenosine phosphosulfate reductase family protein [unclassified Rhodococcus (in: high G+C Gram-positive bacteria)]|uniref:phosphoadenosine phosphosulfate reductase domain-containing protein n=1 Tax=unclassified Rhodococcus (in: high G+C Gram-positive bacteria) TaxID=192944 RepID=UPI0020785B80|nr:MULTISPECIES: phosphoadenosine phosphosulfate reductase family protein [unclassified Rhodococcus (in: high G+C Gram-positive bacteria)]